MGFSRARFICAIAARGWFEKSPRAYATMALDVVRGAVGNGGLHGHGLVRLLAARWRCRHGRIMELSRRYSRAVRLLPAANPGRYSEAIASYDRAIAINPNYSDAYYNRGLAYGNSGNLSKSIFDFNKAIEINPNDSDIYIARGSAYYKTKEYNRAWEDVRKAEELSHPAFFGFLNDLKKTSGRDK